MSRVLVAALISFAAAPDSLEPRRSTSVAPTFGRSISDAELPTQSEFDALARTDCVAFLDAARTRLHREVRTFKATLVKQERVQGTLNNPETIELVGRAEPYSVLMIWKAGARSNLGTTTKGTLYVAGLNAGRIKVRLTSFLGDSSLDIGPTDSLARKSSRFAITEGGLLGATDRAYEAWSEVRARNPKTFDQQWRYIGKEPVKELNGTVCYILERDCEPPELSAFAASDPPRNHADYPDEAFAKIRLIFDAETWVQLGSVMHRADGELIAYYYFKDLQINPDLPANQFTVETLKK